MVQTVADDTVVVVLTNSSDSTADRVTVELRDRGARVLRLDTADFPLRCSLSEYLGDRNELHLERDWAPSGRLDRVTSIWYRRPGHFVVNPVLRPHEQQFATTEAIAGVGGMFRTIDALWVNHPAQALEAQFKVAQLAKARQHGLVIPRSLVTNNPHRAQQFVASCDGNAIIKVLDDPEVPYLQEDPTEPGLIYTSRLDTNDLEQFERVQHTPCLFQELIPKKEDIRVTVVGKNVFATSIDSQSLEAATTDWRRGGMNLEHQAVSLPPQCENAVLQLVRSYGLQYAAIDLAVTPSNEYVFFEINPNGEWEWIEAMTAHHIASSLADLLIGGTGA